MLTAEQMEALQEQNENFEEEIASLKQQVANLQHTQQQHDEKSQIILELEDKLHA